MAREKSQFEKSIEQYITSVDAADERLEQLYTKAKGFYESGKHLEAYNTLLVYFMLDQEAHLRDSQMHMILYNAYGTALDYCDIRSSNEMDKATPLCRELQAAYLDVTIRLARNNNTPAYSLLNRIDADLRDMEAQDPELAAARAEGIKERKMVVEAINALASAGRCDVSNENVRAILEMAEGIIGDAAASAQRIQENLNILRDEKKMANIDERKVLEMVKELTHTYNTVMLTQHLILPALRANTFSLDDIFETKGIKINPSDPNSRDITYSEYAMRLKGLETRMSQVVSFTEKGMYVQINHDDDKRWARINIGFGDRRTQTYTYQAMVEPLQGTIASHKVIDSALIKTEAAALKDHAVWNTSGDKKFTQVDYDGKSDIKSTQKTRTIAGTTLVIELAGFKFNVGLKFMDKEEATKERVANGREITSSGGVSNKDLAKDLADEAAQKTLDAVKEVIENGKFDEDIKKVIGDAVTLWAEVTHRSVKKEKEKPVFSLKTSLSDLTNPWKIPINLVSQNLKHAIGLFKRDKAIEPFKRIAKEVVNFNTANLSNLMDIVEPELQKLDSISPAIVLHDISQIVEQERESLEMDRQIAEAHESIADMVQAAKDDIAATGATSQDQTDNLDDQNGTEDVGHSIAS